MEIVRSSYLWADVYKRQVLSVNRILIDPAVSIPTNFRTKTLFFNIRFILEDKTRVIIIGNPSGTATTIMVTDRVRAYSR